jgi:peptidoglycan hydrolase CwlO-like protein
LLQREATEHRRAHQQSLSQATTRLEKDEETSHAVEAEVDTAANKLRSKIQQLKQVIREKKKALGEIEQGEIDDTGVQGAADDDIMIIDSALKAEVEGALERVKSKH